MPENKDYLVLNGTVHGKTIHLDEETHLPDGWKVIVAIRLFPGDGIRLSAGAWADMTPEEIADFEDIMSQLQGYPVKLPGPDSE